jgi:hypothetical protein
MIHQNSFSASGTSLHIDQPKFLSALNQIGILANHSVYALDRFTPAVGWTLLTFHCTLTRRNIYQHPSRTHIYLRMKSEWGTYSSSVVEGKYEIDRLLSIAQEAVEFKTNGSKLLVKSPERTIPRFLHSGSFKVTAVNHCSFF